MISKIIHIGRIRKEIKLLEKQYNVIISEQLQIILDNHTNNTHRYNDKKEFFYIIISDKCDNCFLKSLGIESLYINLCKFPYHYPKIKIKLLQWSPMNNKYMYPVIKCRANFLYWVYLQLIKKINIPFELWIKIIKYDLNIQNKYTTLLKTMFTYYNKYFATIIYNYSIDWTPSMNIHQYINTILAPITGK